ncbi:MAG: T9SS type A sorting domain-containing protein [Saprospiraceae bacterium]|nr:T9SS type A sorting domain-containing protein [Candidatus Opimibacter skivensis]
MLIDTLVNTENTPGTVYYYFEGIGTGGCFTFEHTVTIDVLPLLDISLMLPVACDAFPMNYVITSSVTGGSGEYEYLWMPGQITTPDITIQNPVEGQVYTLIVYDYAGCIDTASIMVVFDSTLNVNITSSGNLLCSSADPVILTGNASGGEPPYMYQWTLPGGNIVTGQSIEVDTSGMYILTVIDATGCEGVDSVVVPLFDSPEVSIALSHVDSTICAGESETLTGVVNNGQPLSRFQLGYANFIDSVQTIISGSAGVHTLIAVDSNGCSDTAQVTLVVLESPEIDSTLTNQEICFGDSAIFTVVFNGGLAPFDILWHTTTGEDTIQTIIATTEGVYGVMVIDTLGCADSVEVNLQVNELPDLGPDTTKIDICAGDTVLLNPMVNGGEAPFEFMWTTPAGVDTSQSILTGVAGDYQLTVTDNNGCVDYSLYALSMHDLPDVDLGIDTIHTTVNVVLDAGPGFAGYLWSNGSISQTISIGMTGWVFVTVTDHIGCTDADSVYIDFSTALNEPQSTASILIKPNPNKGIFTVEGTIEGMQLIQIDVLNSIGQILYSSKPEKVDVTFSHEVNMSHASPDVYFVRIYLGSRIFQEKIVIQ